MGLDQTAMLICAVLGVVTGIYLLVDGYGGWPIFWYDLKKRFPHYAEKEKLRRKKHE